MFFPANKGVSTKNKIYPIETKTVPANPLKLPCIPFKIPFCSGLPCWDNNFHNGAQKIILAKA